MNRRRSLLAVLTTAGIAAVIPRHGGSAKATAGTAPRRQYLVLSLDRADTEHKVPPLIPAEIARARALYLSGFLRQIWSRADVNGGCALVEAKSESEIRKIWASYPLAEAGVLSVDRIVALLPFTVDHYTPPATPVS